MSFLLAGKAFSVKVGNPTRKLVLIKLAENANDKGVCWPSYQHIADHCECSRRTVITHIEKLVDMGLLRKFYRKGEKGNSSNQYLLTLDGEKSAPSKPSENIAPPPSENIAPASAEVSPPSENAAPPPSENISPRTYHSSEPINEPVCGPSELSPDDNHQPPANDSHTDRMFRNAIESSRLITMSEAWQPSENFVGMCRMQRIDLSSLSTDEQEEIINEFRCYWMTREGSAFPQNRWDHKLTSQVKRHLENKSRNQNSGDRRAMVSSSVMDVRNTDW